MLTRKTVYIPLPIACTASYEEACAAIADLTPEERAQLLAMLQERFPNRFVP